jgi:hypothetical protein
MRWYIFYVGAMGSLLNARVALQVAFFALCMALAGVIFFYIDISMGWLYVSSSFLDALGSNHS